MALLSDDAACERWRWKRACKEKKCLAMIMLWWAPKNGIV